MKFTTAAALAVSATTATAYSNSSIFQNGPAGCGICKPFTIDVTRGATDPSKMISRDSILTNGTLPGPALHLKVGECVDFTVINNMADATGVHFHGIRQLETPWSDGTPGLSQSAIKSGETYTYRWLADEAGVYFYHAHFKSQMMDGLYGAIVIDAAEGASKPFSSIGDVAALEAAESKIETVFASDWNRFTSAEFFDIEKNANIDDACTDSIILNGQGSQYCYTAAQLTANQRPQVPFILGNSSLTAKGCIPPTNPLIQGAYTRTYSAIPAGAYDVCTPYTGSTYTYEVSAAAGWAAMSFISPSGFTLLTVTIDGHKLYVYGLNGQYITPQVVDQINVTPGDRVSFFVKLDQAPADYTIRVANAGLNQVISGFGTLRYKGASGPGSAPALMNIGGVSPPNSTIVLLNNAKAVPFLAPAVGVVADKTFVLDVMKTPKDTRSYSWVLNGATPYDQSTDDGTPLLYQGPTGAPNSDLILRTNYNDWVDLIIKVAGPLAQPHPIHKHANKFYVIGSGVGDFNYTTVAAATAAGVSFNLVNPPFLDGFTSTPAQGSGTWMVFRYQANTPGAWFMHCHIQSHFTGGMAVAILDAVDKWPALPSHPGDVCKSNNTIPIVIPTPPIKNGTEPIKGNGTSTSTTSGSKTSTTSGYGSGATTTSVVTTTASGKWGGWGDWTSADSDATHVPNKGFSTVTRSDAKPTGHGDGSYDWAAWKSVEAAASSAVAAHGGPAKTILPGGNAINIEASADGAWGAWNGASSTSTKTSTKTSSKPVDPATGTWSAWSDPTATSVGSASTWAAWDSADPSTKVDAASASWSAWSTGTKATGTASKATGVSASTASGSASWSAWSTAASVDPTSSWGAWSSGASATTVPVTGVDAASTWASWSSGAGASATGVASYSPSGIKTYTGAASSLKTSGAVVGALAFGIVALLL